MDPNVRIREIQSKVSEERLLISELEAKIKNPSLKSLLRGPSFTLDDLENLFIASALRETRTKDALTVWLDHAEFFLSLAKQERKAVEEMTATYGPDATLI